MFGRKKEAKRLLKKLPFYKTPIEKPYTKRLRNFDMLRELPFYDELNILKVSKAFQGYGHSYSLKTLTQKIHQYSWRLVNRVLKTFSRTD